MSDGHEEIPGQLALFEINEPVATDADASALDKAFPTNLVEWALGQEAGYRGDELVTPKSDDYMRGYEQGQASKAAYLEMTKRG